MDPVAAGLLARIGIVGDRRKSTRVMAA